MIPDRYIIKLGSQNFVKYEGLLDIAHQKELVSIMAEITQFPDEDNSMTCIASAVLRGKNGEVFQDFGDANPQSCNSKIVPHLIRMASTRAKARVLRDFTNIGMCSIEELGDQIDSNSKAVPPMRPKFAK